MNSNHSRRRRATALLAGSAMGALAMLWSAAAQAQDAPAPAAGTDASKASQVADIIVTAQKRSERLQDVPASVSVVNVQNLSQEGLVRLADYASQVPGLSLTSPQEGKTQVTIRGITTGPAQSASSTGFYIDEAPFGSVNAYTVGSALTPDLDPSDLANVEVLKGPQGTLYGADSVGGILKYVTTEPDFQNYGGHFALGVSHVDGGGDGHTERALVNLPVIKDWLVIKLSGFDRDDPGYIDNVLGANDVNRATVRGARAVVSAKIDDNLRVDLSAMAQKTHAYGSDYVDVTAGTLAPIYGDMEQRRFTGEPGTVDFRIYNATVHDDIGQFKLVSSTTYQTIKSNQTADGTLTYGALLGGIFGIPDLGIRSHQTTETKRFSQEFRVDSKIADKLDYQIGLYFTHEDDQNRIPGFDPFSTTTGLPYPLPSIVTASILSRYTEYSAFANATYHFTDQFDILGGVRYSIDHQHYAQDYAGLIVGPERINTGTEDGHIATFLVSPRFKFTPDSMVYVRVASGYRPGGPNAVPPPSVYVAPDTFQPDKLISYEAGYKGQFFDRMLTVDAAAFYTTWKDIQIQTSAGGFNFFVNGGDARSEGGELTVRLTPVRGLALGFNGAYTNAELTSPAPAAGGLDGDRLPFVPRWSGSLTADYTFPLSGYLDGVLSGSVNYVGERTSDYTNRGGQSVPAYTTVNLRAGVQHEGWTLSLYGKNLGDSRGILLTSGETLVPGLSPLAAAIITPRTFGAELDVKF